MSNGSIGTVITTVCSAYENCPEISFPIKLSLVSQMSKLAE